MLDAIMTKEVLLSIGSVVLGGIVGLIFQVVYEIAAIRQVSFPVFGTWLSAYQPTIASGWEWTTEEVLIRRWLGKIIMRNRANSRGHEWEGTARILDRQFLVGEWRATNMQARGAFCLVFGFERTYMVGFFFGPDDTERKFASAFVLGRSAHDIERAKTRLASLRPMLSQRNLGTE